MATTTSRERSAEGFSFTTIMHPEAEQVRVKHAAGGDGFVLEVEGLHGMLVGWVFLDKAGLRKVHEEASRLLAGTRAARQEGGAD